MKLNRKVGLTIAAATLGVVMVVSLGAVAMAAGPNGAQGNGLGTGTCPEAVTQLLGMTREEIQAQRLEGKSLVQIAETKNVTQEQLVDAIVAERQAQIQERVTAGTLTQEQATLMLQNMEHNVVRAITRSGVGRPDWAGTGQQGLRTAGSGACLGGAGANGSGFGRQMGRAAR